MCRRDMLKYEDDFEEAEVMTVQQSVRARNSNLASIHIAPNYQHEYQEGLEPGQEVMIPGRIRLESNHSHMNDDEPEESKAVIEMSSFEDPLTPTPHMGMKRKATTIISD